MAKYCKPFDLHRIMPEIRPLLQPGQHVTASGARGVWAGFTRAGVSVVLWVDSVEGRSTGAYARKFARLRDYARANAA